MSTDALIENGVVINLIVWDGNTENWQPPSGVTAVVVLDGQAHIGDTYNGTSFTSPAASAPAPTLAQAQKAATLSLYSDCQSAITSGFSSAALGSAYAYPSSLTDQANQKSVAASSSGGLLWCEAGGEWAFVQHTQDQAQAVVESFTAWLNACQQQLVTLLAQINTPTATTASVLNIAWSNPANTQEA